MGLSPTRMPRVVLMLAEMETTLGDAGMVSESVCVHMRWG